MRAFQPNRASVRGKSKQNPQTRTGRLMTEGTLNVIDREWGHAASVVRRRKPLARNVVTVVVDESTFAADVAPPQEKHSTVKLGALLFLLLHTALLFASPAVCACVPIVAVALFTPYGSRFT